MSRRSRAASAVHARVAGESLRIDALTNRACAGAS